MTEEEKEAEKHAEVVDRVPTSFHIRKVDLEKHGYSTGCPGCKSILRGDVTLKSHCPRCRARDIEWLT